MESINYHRAGINDLQTLVELRIKFLSDLWGKQSPEAETGLRNELGQYFSKSLQDNSCIFYLSKSGNEVVGIGGMILREQPGNFKHPNGKFGYIINMYTIPAFRRKGICSSILKKLISEAERIGISAFELLATEEGALVYTKQGFKKHDQPLYRRYSPVSKPY